MQLKLLCLVISSINLLLDIHSMEISVAFDVANTQTQQPERKIVTVSHEAANRSNTLSHMQKYSHPLDAPIHFPQINYESFTAFTPYLDCKDAEEIDELIKKEELATRAYPYSVSLLRISDLLDSPIIREKILEIVRQHFFCEQVIQEAFNTPNFIDSLNAIGLNIRSRNELAQYEGANWWWQPKKFGMNHNRTPYVVTDTTIIYYCKSNFKVYGCLDTHFRQKISPKEIINNLIATANGNTIITSGIDRWQHFFVITIYNKINKKYCLTTQFRKTQQIDKMTITPDGKTFIVSFMRSVDASVYSEIDGRYQCLPKFKAPIQEDLTNSDFLSCMAIRRVAISFDATIIVTCAKSAIRVYDKNDGEYQLSQMLEDHAGANFCQIADDETYTVFSFHNESVHIYVRVNGQYTLAEKLMLRKFSGVPPKSLFLCKRAATVDGKTIISALNDTIDIYSNLNGKFTLSATLNSRQTSLEKQEEMIYNSISNNAFFTLDPNNVVWVWQRQPVKLLLEHIILIRAALIAYQQDKMLDLRGDRYTHVRGWNEN